MKWWGLTGGIACGKTEVARLLSERGFAVINADEVAHQALVQGSPVLSQIVDVFGDEILDSQGNVNRVYLGQVVFENKDLLLKLESIVHPFVQAEVQKQRQEYEQRGVKFCFYDVPLLFEKNLQSQFDGVIVVSCKPEIQLQRLMKRNGLTQQQAQKRIQSQLPLAEKIKQADIHIENNGTLEELKQKCSSVVPRI